MSLLADASEEIAADASAGTRCLGVDPAAAWLSLRTSSAAPSRVSSMLELDGYLTGVIVAPSLIAPVRWLASLWAEDDPVLVDKQQFTAALESVMARYSTLRAEIDASLERLQTERVCDWRPMFQPADTKPRHAAVRQWAAGFWAAAAFDPVGWSAYLEDERTQLFVTPLVGFAPFYHGQGVDPAEDIEALLDEAAAAIPRSVLVLRLIAQMRADRHPSRGPCRLKIGRNDPCPCGSGCKYKRCCGES